MILDNVNIVVIGIFLGALILTIGPWYLKLRAIQQKAEEEGVEPTLPKFNIFYVVTAGISIVIAGVTNLTLVDSILQNNPDAQQYQLFITSLLSSAGSNAILNLISKTGSSDVVLVTKKDTEPAPQ